MPATTPAEAKGFKLIGHDATAAWGGGSLVQMHKGHAYVGAVGGSSFNGPEGFTVHDVRDPTKPHKVGEFRAPPGIHCHKLRFIVGDDPMFYVNSERLAGDKSAQERQRCRLFHFRRIDAVGAEADSAFGRHAGLRAAPGFPGVDLQARNLAFSAERCAGLDEARRSGRSTSRTRS